MIQEDKSATLSTLNDQYLFQPVEVILDDQGGQQISVRTDGKAPTLRAEAHGHPPCVMCYDARGNGDGLVAPTITGDHNDRVTDYTAVVCMAHGQANAEICKEKCPCLNCDHEQPIVFCLQGNIIDRCAKQNGSGICEGVCHTLNAVDKHGVVYCFDKEVYNSGEKATGGHYIVEGGPAPTLRTEHPPGVCFRYIVRRLTPTECARLQGFLDAWGHPEKKEDFTDEELAFWMEVRNTHASINGKPVKEYTKAQMLTWYNKLHTDSAEYKMWGNGIALPCALYVMEGIEEAVEEEVEHGRESH